MQVAGECFANSEKYYHGAVTILKIKLIIFLAFGIGRFGNLFFGARAVMAQGEMGRGGEAFFTLVGQAAEMRDRPNSHLVSCNLQ